MFYHSLLYCEYITNRNMFHNNTYQENKQLLYYVKIKGTVDSRNLMVLWHVLNHLPNLITLTSLDTVYPRIMTYHLPKLSGGYLVVGKCPILGILDITL